jgi:hypothetical protein
MNNKAILGLSLSAVLVMGMTGYVYASEHWWGANDGGAEMKNNLTWKLTADATGDVPRNTEQLAGFGWLYAFPPNTSDNEIDAFGITIHDADLNGDGKNDVRDSLQNKEGWHGHNFIFSAGTSASDFCVKEIVDAPQVGIGIKGDSVTVQVRDSALAGPLLDTAVGYEILVDTGCDATVPTGDIVDPEILEDLGLLEGLPLGIDVVGLGVGQ